MRPVPLLLVALTLSLASSPAVAKTGVGVITGFNFATLSIEGVSNMDPRGAFAAGAAVDYGINDRWGILLEPMFTSKGGKSTERDAYWGSNDGAVFQLDCIDIPLLARLDLGAAATHGYVLAGPGVSFATESKVKITQGSYQETVDFSDVLNPVDLSFDLGAGISFPQDVNRITVDARVAFGITDINQGGTVTFKGSPLVVPSKSTHTLDFRLFATYLFSLPGH